MKINLFYILLLLLILILVIEISNHKLIKLSNKKHKKHKDTVFLFWTGGFDSTFRLCELSIEKGKYVQPIYMGYNIDSKKKTDYWVRNNRKQEYKSMENIIKEINKKFPQTKYFIKQPIVVNKSIPNKDFDDKLNKLNLWPKKRKIHQYNHLFRYAYQNHKPIEIGVLGLHDTSKFVKYLNKNLIKKKGNWKFPNKNLLENIKFQLFKRTKFQLYDQSVENGYDHILAMSWSCWKPTRDGSACEKCDMCRERIIYQTPPK